jgi:Secretion system C-terminal sorting domain
MKKIIYTGVFLGSIALLFLNNSGGPAVAQKKGYTGSPVKNGTTEGTCQNCHNAGTFNPTAKLEVFDSAGTVAATSYQLGKVYNLRLTITAGAGTPGAYGFQMIDIRKSDSSNIKGFLAKAQQAANIGIDTIADTEKRVYAEHNAKLTSNIINVKWRAPATSRGAIVFYAVGNASNGTGGSGGDNGTSSVNVQLNDATSAVNDLATKVTINIAPNPTSDRAEIFLSSTESRNLQVRLTDITGRIVLTDYWKVVAGDNQKSVDLHNVAKGVYLIQLIENQDVISKKIIKF